MKNRYIAALLALVLGQFGVHRFYLRQGGLGIVYILLTILGISLLGLPIAALIGVIDAVMIFMMGDEEFNFRYNKNATQRAGNNRGKQTFRTKDSPRRAKRILPKANPFKKSGVSKYKDFDLKGAIEDFNKGLEIAPNDISIHFNLACAYSMTEDVKKAYYHLDKAVALGYDDFEKIKTHDDLAYVRIQDKYLDFEKNGFRIGARANKTIESGERMEGGLLDQLNKLKELRDKGLISELEFVKEKQKLVR